MGRCVDLQEPRLFRAVAGRVSLLRETAADFWDPEVQRWIRAQPLCHPHKQQQPAVSTLQPRCGAAKETVTL